MLKLGSLFSGIGGFELGLERAIPSLETVWQVEQDKFCQKVLKKHWPNALLFDDVKTVGKHNLEPVDILCGGFPCQDISTAGKGKGLKGAQSGLWFEMLRIISELRPKIVVLENVAAITFRGLNTVVYGLTENGYGVEWQIISARQFGAPHIRKRWFAVAYSKCKLAQIQTKRQQSSVEKFRSLSPNRSTQWESRTIEPVVSRMDNGIPRRMDRIKRLKSLGNAIVPQCSEYIGMHILKSGLL